MGPPDLNKMVMSLNPFLYIDDKQIEVEPNVTLSPHQTNAKSRRRIVNSVEISSAFQVLEKRWIKGLPQISALTIKSLGNALEV